MYYDIRTTSTGQQYNPRCQADGCTKQRVIDKNGYPRSSYCRNHRLHQRHQGHPTIPVPIATRGQYADAYHVGELWVKWNQKPLASDIEILEKVRTTKSRWITDGKILKRLEPKWQFVYMMQRTVDKHGAVKTLQKLMGIYNAWKNTSMNWDFIHRPRQEPLYFAKNMFRRLWPSGYGQYKRRVMEYIGAELLKIAKGIDENNQGMHRIYLRGTEAETLDECWKRFKTFKRHKAEGQDVRFSRGQVRKHRRSVDMQMKRMGAHKDALMSLCQTVAKKGG